MNVHLDAWLASVAPDRNPLPELVAEWKRRKSLEDEATADDEADRSAGFKDEMDLPICSARPRRLAGLKARAEFLRQELAIWSRNGMGSEVNCIFDNFFGAVNELQDGPETPAGESPLRALHTRWQVTKAEYRALPDDHDEATAECTYQRIREIEREAMAYEPRSMEDLAFQVIFADDDGDMSANTDQEALAARAYALVGIEPKRSG